MDKRTRNKKIECHYFEINTPCERIVKIKYQQNLSKGPQSNLVDEGKITNPSIYKEGPPM